MPTMRERALERFRFLANRDPSENELVEFLTILPPNMFYDCDDFKSPYPPSAFDPEVTE